MVIKTDAPFEIIWKMREDWIKINSNEKGELDWSEIKEIKHMLKSTIPRFLPNPEKNWGPKKGAILNIHREKDIELKKKNN